MEISWYRFLEDLDVHPFVERDTMRYALSNERNGKIYLTDQHTAAQILAIKNDPKKVKRLDDGDLKNLLSIVEKIRVSDFEEASQKKPFNPMFIRWEGFPIARFNSQLKIWSEYAVRILPVFTAICIFSVLFLGFANEWSILGAASGSLSFQGLAIFAAISPLLKIPHELGHALVARAYNVPIYKAGIIFVGFYPLPFVDASQADITAPRHARIRISLAGIFVDLMIAMLAFIAWHFATGDLLKTIFSSIFVFSSLNSILFNGNPFIRLDGYYAFSDWMGHRNLSTASSKLFREVRRKILRGGMQMADYSKRDWGYLTYAMGALIYKINILFTIFILVMPRFFGLGVFFVLWGGYVMFFSPLFKNAPTSAETNGRGAINGPLITVLGVVALAFLPIKVTLHRDAILDSQQSYLLQTEARGYLMKLADNGTARINDTLFELENFVLTQDAELAQKEVETAELLVKSLEQIDPFQTRLAQIELDARTATQQLMAEGQGKLAHSAENAGAVFTNPELRLGQFLNEAQNLGYFLPQTETSILKVEFPEFRLEKLRQSKAEIWLWANGKTVPIEMFELVQSQNREVLDMIARAPVPPLELHGMRLILKIKLDRQPLYQHGLDWIAYLQRNYRATRASQ